MDRGDTSRLSLITQMSVLKPRGIAGVVDSHDDPTPVSSIRCVHGPTPDVADADRVVVEFEFPVEVDLADKRHRWKA